MHIAVNVKNTYGPRSEGVTGSEGGGGRLIKVGVLMMLSRLILCLRLSEEPFEWPLEETSSQGLVSSMWQQGDVRLRQ